MPIKLGNNASAHVAAHLANYETSIVLVADEIGGFPTLGPGEWFPMTLVDPDGDLEIVKVTAMAGNILTAVRAQEDTSARTFIIGSRAEIRVTAGVFDAIREEAENTATENMTVALGALVPVGFGPIPWSRPAPPDGWIFADGRTLDGATPYAALRAAYIADLFPYGQDGSGNPKIPDMRGRTAAGLDNMTGSAAGRLTGATLGAGLGSQTHALTTGEMAAHNHGVNDPGHVHGVSDPTHAHAVYDPGHYHINPSGEIDTNHGAVTSGTGLGYSNRLYASLIASNTSAVGTGIGIYGAATGVSVVGNVTGVTTQTAGAGAAHNNVQPTLAAPFIVKV